MVSSCFISQFENIELVSQFGHKRKYTFYQCRFLELTRKSTGAKSLGKLIKELCMYVGNKKVPFYHIRIKKKVGYKLLYRIRYLISYNQSVDKPSLSTSNIQVRSRISETATESCWHRCNWVPWEQGTQYLDEFCVPLFQKWVRGAVLWREACDKRSVKNAFLTVSTTFPEFHVSGVHFRFFYFFNYLLQCVKILKVLLD